MRGRQSFRFDDFSKGVDLSVGPYLLAAGFGRDARNVVSSERGSLTKRGGSVHVTGWSSGSLLGLAAFSSPQSMVANTSTALLGFNLGVPFPIGGALTPSSAQWCWESAPSPDTPGLTIYGSSADAGNAPRRWNGVGSLTPTWLQTGGAPMHRAAFLKYAGNRMWLGNILDDPSAVRWSDLATPSTYPAANITRFDPDDGAAITGLSSHGPYVLVFKPTKIWRVYDLDTSANVPVSKAIGCVSHRSIAETPKGTLFLSRDGVYSTDGQSVSKVSKALDPLLKALPAGSLGNASGAYFDNRYRLAVSTTGGANDLVLDLDLDTGAWWIHSLPVVQFAVWEQSGIPGLYSGQSSFGSPVVRKVFVPGVDFDHNIPIAAYWKSAWHTFGSTASRKRVRQVHFDGNGKVLFRVGKSFSAGSTLVSVIDFNQADGFFGVDDGGSFGAGSDFYGGSFELGEVEAYTLGTGRAWSLILGNETSDPFTVHSYTFNVDQRKD